MGDPRNTGTLQDIVPEARPHFERLIADAQKMGISLKVRSAGRTCADQQALKALGPGVTGAGMCRSLHTVGRAVDFDAWPNDCATYTRLGQLWESWGGTWGGRWSQFGGCGDAGHFHFMPGHQSTPVELCPSDVTLADCERLRSAYLDDQFGGGFSWPKLLGVTAAAAGVAGAIWWSR